MADAETVFIELSNLPVNGDHLHDLNIPKDLDASGIVKLMKEDSSNNMKRLLDDWELLRGLEIKVTVYDADGKRTSDSWTDGD